MIRMIAVDMDGTLLNARGEIGPANRAALLAAEQAGIRVVVATGRRHSYAMRQLRSAGLADHSVLVSSNGAVTRTLGPGAHLVHRTFLSTETSLWLCDHIREFRNALVITFDRVRPDGEDERGALVVEHLEDLHSSIDRWMIANAPYIDHVVPIERALVGPDGQPLTPPIQMMLCGTVERMRRAEARLLEDPGVFAVGVMGGSVVDGTRLSLSRTEYPERDLSIVDILPPGCDKGTALRRLAEGWGINLSELMAIGDNWNDTSMLDVAGAPVLMANAPADLLAIAAERGWRIGGHHDADGVAEAIEQALAAVVC